LDPKTFSDSGDKNHVKRFELNLNRLHKDLDFLYSVLTRDETSVYYYDPESRQASREGKGMGEKPAARAKSQNSAEKAST